MPQSPHRDKHWGFLRASNGPGAALLSSAPCQTLARPRGECHCIPDSQMRTLGDNNCKDRIRSLIDAMRCSMLII